MSPEDQSARIRDVEIPTDILNHSTHWKGEHFGFMASFDFRTLLSHDKVNLCPKLDA